MDEFVKRFPHAQPGQVEWEVRGLQWLAAAGGAPVVRVVRHDDHELVEERLAEVAPDSGAARDFGAALARTHAAGSPGYGSGPDGWLDEWPGWIGTARLPLGHHDRWGEFYAAERVMPYLRRARDEGIFGPREATLFDRLCTRLVSGDFDDDTAPARIHGDLWSGNALYTASGVTLIDPAAHGGHPLTDLAMLELFGYPQLDAVWAGYGSVRPVPADWHRLVPLHQVHPLLVHTVLFGGSYAAAAVAAARIFATPR